MRLFIRLIRYNDGSHQKYCKSKKHLIDIKHILNYISFVKTCLFLGIITIIFVLK